jgi:hypothetical protein
MEQMETRIADGLILEFHGKIGDRLVMRSKRLPARKVLRAWIAKGSGPYPKEGEIWSSDQALCLGSSEALTRRGNELLFTEEVMLVRYPYDGRQFDVVIERIDTSGNRYSHDGIREDWESPLRKVPKIGNGIIASFRRTYHPLRNRPSLPFIRRWVTRLPRLLSPLSFRR